MSLADEIAPGADGLSQLRALMASGRKPGILAALQFELVEAELGRAVFAGVPGEHAYNPIGTVHGGYAATLLDSACGCAVHSRLTAAQAYTTLELKVSYLRAARHRALSSGERQGNAEGLVESTKPCRPQAGQVIREPWLGNADEAVAVDARFMLQAFLRTDVDLGRQTVTAGVDGRADDGREA